MRTYNGKTYKLVEADEALITEEHIACDQCALSELCDSVSNEINDIEYLLCEEDEDLLQDFTCPVYAEVLQEELIGKRIDE